jgi:hypothetical protein
MIRAKVVPNKMHEGRSFVCFDVAREPYVDGMGRPLRDADGNPKFQMEPSLINHDVSDELAQALVQVWNARCKDVSLQRAPEHEGRPKMLAKHFSNGRVAKFWLHDRWRGAEDARCQTMLYVATHPDFPTSKPDDEVPMRHLLWQGNRFTFGLEVKGVSIELRTNAPDWRTYQRLYPDCEFHVVWP